MVYRIDGDARRRVLAEAVWRVVRRDGFEAASVRGVAAEAGLSAGSVRHAFPTQAALHRFAMEELYRDVAECVARARAEAADDPVERAVAALLQLLPDGEHRRAEYVAYLAFLARAAVDESLLDVARESYRAMDGLYASLLDELHAAGRLRTDVRDRDLDEADLIRAARGLGLLLDGLLLREVALPTSDARGAEAEIRSFLAGLGARSVGTTPATTAGVTR